MKKVLLCKKNKQKVDVEGFNEIHLSLPNLSTKIA